MEAKINKPLAPVTSLPIATTYLSDNQIGKRYGVSRQTVWRWVLNDPDFPKPIKLSPGCTRWKLSSLEAWESGKGAA